MCSSSVCLLVIVFVFVFAIAKWVWFGDCVIRGGHSTQIPGVARTWSAGPQSPERLHQPLSEERSSSRCARSSLQACGSKELYEVMVNSSSPSRDDVDAVPVRPGSSPGVVTPARFGHTPPALSLLGLAMQSGRTWWPEAVTCHPSLQSPAQDAQTAVLFPSISGTQGLVCAVGCPPRSSSLHSVYPRCAYELVLPREAGRRSPQATFGD